MVLQAYIDESIDSAEGDWFVLGGYIASAEAWAGFSRVWEQLLPTHGVMDPNGIYRFKMSEMAMLPERMKRVPAFYRAVEECALTSVSVAFRTGDLRAAQDSITAPGVANIDWGILANPYRFAFLVLMDMFHSQRNEEVVRTYVPPAAKVDFIFDNRMEKKGILEGWDQYLSLRPDIRSQYGATPIFVDDNDYLPLQAADLGVWWVRHWFATLGPDADLHARPFPWKVADKRPSMLSITAARKDIADHMLRVIRKMPNGELAHFRD